MQKHLTVLKFSPWNDATVSNVLKVLELESLNRSVGKTLFSFSTSYLIIASEFSSVVASRPRTIILFLEFNSRGWTALIEILDFCMECLIKNFVSVCFIIDCDEKNIRNKYNFQEIYLDVGKQIYLRYFCTGLVALKFYFHCMHDFRNSQLNLNIRQNINDFMTLVDV